MARVTFDLDDEWTERMNRYLVDRKQAKNIFGEEALKERIVRCEGRDKRAQRERALADKEMVRTVIKEMVSSGEIPSGAGDGGVIVV